MCLGKNNTHSGQEGQHTLCNGASSFDKGHLLVEHVGGRLHELHVPGPHLAFDKDLSWWDTSAVGDASSSLSDCNKALIHAGFDAQTSAWPYSWGSLRARRRLPPVAPSGVQAVL